MVNTLLNCTICRGQREALIHAFKRPVVTLLDAGVSKPTVCLWCAACKTKTRHVATILADKPAPRPYTGGESVTVPKTCK